MHRALQTAPARTRLVRRFAGSPFWNSAARSRQPVPLTIKRTGLRVWSSGRWASHHRTGFTSIQAAKKLACQSYSNEVFQKMSKYLTYCL